MSAQFDSFGPVDGVLVVDVVMLRELLSVIGPVDVDGITYTADNIEQQILNENYLRFDSGDGRRRASRGTGRDRLGDLRGVEGTRRGDRRPRSGACSAPPTVATSSPTPTIPTSRTCGSTSAPRGRSTPLALMVTVQNIAADKLDWYIDPTVTLRAVPDDRFRCLAGAPHGARAEPRAGADQPRDRVVHRGLRRRDPPRAGGGVPPRGRLRGPEPRRAAVQRGGRRPADADGREADLHRGGRDAGPWRSSSRCQPSTGRCGDPAVGTRAAGVVRGERCAARPTRSHASCSSRSAPPERGHRGSLLPSPAVLAVAGRGERARRRAPSTPPAPGPTARGGLGARAAASGARIAAVPRRRRASWWPAR